MATLDEWREVFDGWADQDPNIASTGDLRDDAELDELAETLADWLELDGSQRVLDVGCANGNLTRRWARLAQQVVGVDYSPRLVAEARKVGDDIVFERAESADLPFEAARFDALCCYGVLCCVPDVAYALASVREFARVVKPGGRMVIGGLPDRRRHDRFVELLESGGRWYHRWLPRGVREVARRVVRPGVAPPGSNLLWFDIDSFVADLRADGWSVEVHDDPIYADYEKYRTTLILQRRATGGR